MVESCDIKTEVFYYADSVFLSFWAVSKTTFCYETPCITNIYLWYTAFRFWHFKIQRKHNKKTNRCSKSCSNSRKWWRWWWRRSSILWRSFEYRSVTERHGTSRNVTERKRNWSCCGKVFVWKCQDFNGLKSNNFFIHVIIKLFSILVFYKFQFK